MIPGIFEQPPNEEENALSYGRGRMQAAYGRNPRTTRHAALSMAPVVTRA